MWPNGWSALSLNLNFLPKKKKKTSWFGTGTRTGPSVSRFKNVESEPIRPPDRFRSRTVGMTTLIHSTPSNEKKKYFSSTHKRNWAPKTLFNQWSDESPYVIGIYSHHYSNLSPLRFIYFIHQLRFVSFGEKSDYYL